MLSTRKEAINGQAVASGSMTPSTRHIPPPIGFYGGPIWTVKGWLHPHELPDTLPYNEYPYHGKHYLAKRKQRSAPNATAT